MKMLHAKFQYAHWRYVLDRTPKIIPQNPSQSLQLEQKVERFHTNLSGFRWLRGKNTCYRQLDTYTRQINACVCKWAIRVAGYIFLLEEGVVTDNTFPLAAINPLLDRWSVKCNSVLLAKTNVESLCRPSPLPYPGGAQKPSTNSQWSWRFATALLPRAKVISLFIFFSLSLSRPKLRLVSGVKCNKFDKMTALAFVYAWTRCVYSVTPVVLKTV